MSDNMENREDLEREDTLESPETLYSIPGIGYVSYQAMVGGDIPFSMFYLTFLAILTLAGNLISDILYAVVDPRVRIS